MSTLIVLTLVWVAIVVLALVAALGTTAWNLRRAKHNIAGIADNLERVADQAEPLDLELESIGNEVEAIVNALVRADDALSNVLGVLERLRAPQKG